MIKLPTALIERATSKYDNRLTHVYFDKDESRLIATDGSIIAVIPIESQCGDKGGCISPSAIRMAREMGGKMELHDEKIVISSSYLGTASLPRHSRPDRWGQRLMGKVRRIIGRAPRKDAVAVALDARKLLQLAEALLDDPERHCGLKLYIQGPEEPVLVEPHKTSPREYEDGRFGLIAPMLG